MVYLLSKIKVLNKSIQKLNLIISKNQKDWVYIIIIIILLSFLIVFNKNNLGSGINYYINAGMVIFIIASFVYVIYNKFQRQAMEDKYNESMEYVLRYEKIINEQGKKNHEYNNQNRHPAACGDSGNQGFRSGNNRFNGKCGRFGNRLYRNHGGFCRSPCRLCCSLCSFNRND